MTTSKSSPMTRRKFFTLSAAAALVPATLITTPVPVPSKVHKRVQPLVVTTWWTHDNRMMMTVYNPNDVPVEI